MGFLRTVRRGLTWTALGLAGGAVVVTARHLLEMPQPLQSALPGAGRVDRQHGGEMYYNVAGPEDAQAVLLLHDFSPGASNYEFRGVFSLLSADHRVYALDWLGYGMSERPNVAYTGEFYAGVLTGFLRDVVGRPAMVIGLGRAANVAVRAASDSPALVSQAVLVSPYVAAETHLEPTLPQTLMRAMQRAFLGLVPYALLSTRPALRWAVRRESRQPGSSAASEGTVTQRYTSSHQFGGQYAPLAMLTGELDLPVRNAFALLAPPALVVIGADDPERPAAAVTEWTSVKPHAAFEVIPNAGYQVCEDQPQAFVTALRRWLGTLPPMVGNIPGQLAQPAPADTERSAGESGSEAGEAWERDMPGTPGYVVPGVSDMGLEGASTVTIGGITTMEPELELGPEPVPSEAALQADYREQGLEGTPTELLPEAGEAAPSAPPEEQAREGTNPPLAPADNIASVEAAAGEQEAAQTESEQPPVGDEGITRSARTSTPGATAEEEPLRPTDKTDVRPTAPQPRIPPGPQVSTHAAPSHRPSAHPEPRAKGGKSASGRGGARPTGSKSTGSGPGGGTSAGRGKSPSKGKHGPSR
jgi:pimeloyl-ACP methyl ester carboxylesterase